MRKRRCPVKRKLCLKTDGEFMKQISHKDFIGISLIAVTMIVLVSLLSRFFSGSWIQTVGGFILMYFPVLLVYVMVQRRRDKREAKRKSSKSSNLRTHTTQSNAVGKALVAQRKSDLFFRMKMYGICALFGILAGFTISGFWSTMLNMNRCPVCGQYNAQKVHRKGSDASFYFTCSGGMKINQFRSPKPQQNRLVLPPDDR